ncbi:hypothetical protein [Candidatus Kryptonium thompsonii]|uniref:hypothetical protein n=1 Tax=Candidatus Kryptonium thompsonii TaxID=1633631 RepID=UPI00070722E0|nr:hypothetical protein [Candidatus Kryptonium thompsoni]CUT06508.1 hypothetical protein JGI11_01847 [Candidatus Kryptonium thompsoni]
MVRRVCFIFIAILILSLPLISQSKVGTTAAPFLGIAVGPRAIGLVGLLLLSLGMLARCIGTQLEFQGLGEMR